MFGGVSAEHEVSIITGLQVVEKIDRTSFDTFVVFWGQDGVFYYYPNLTNRKQWKTIKPKVCFFGRDQAGVFIQEAGLLRAKHYLDVAYLAFHGGKGESGQIQGMLESLGLPFTSSSSESSSITMNKSLTNQVLAAHKLATIPGVSCRDTDFNDNPDGIVAAIRDQLGLPVIIKPAHLGSSIGIKIAKTEIELLKYLTEATLIDNEVQIEKLMVDFVEYNCAVRNVGGQIEFSEIERPMGKDEILSFADKYQRGGGKKTGATSGMASLSRELPAKISAELKDRIHDSARKIFQACRCSGMVRIDFMHTKHDELFITEVNPIPGSMAYYLWEAAGLTFQQQITDLLTQAIADQKKRDSKQLIYTTDIVDKFIA